MKPYYQDAAGVVLYHGDCREVLPLLEPVDVVITSPPYNLGSSPWPHLGNWQFRDKQSGGHCGGKWRNGQDAALGVKYGVFADAMPWPEYVQWQQEILRLLWGKLTDSGAIFYNHKPRVIGAKLWTPLELIPEIATLRQIIIWARPGGMNYKPTAFVPTHEWIMILAKESWRLKSQSVSGLGDVWRMAPDTNRHPAPFPLELPAKVIEATEPKVVLDPFVGSGTTLRAAKDNGCRAIGIEIDERYCEMTARRLEQGVLAFTD